MVNGLEKFMSVIGDEHLNEVFFRHDHFEYQVSLCGRYIIVEDTRTGESEEFCFDAPREKLCVAFLDASPRGTRLRDILSHLDGKEVIAVK